MRIWSTVVFHKTMLSLFGSTVAIALFASQPAYATKIADEAGLVAAIASPQDRAGPNRSASERAQQARQAGSGRRGERGPVAPTPEENLQAAQAQLSAAGKDCQVTEAVLLGNNAQQQGLYEAACSTGPGYIVVASTPPVVVDCLELAGTAATARARDPEADVGQQCAIPANNNGLAVLSGWAREAGVTCTVDQAIAAGKSAAGNTIYEIGCANQDGYWLERTSSGWSLQDCLQIVSANGVCKFTTPQEQAAGFQPKLTGTDAAACDVQAVRLMGQNENGRFYEAKCAAGDGYIARVNAESVTQQVYPCATAQLIGGGCTLTTATPVAGAATEQ